MTRMGIRKPNALPTLTKGNDSGQSWEERTVVVVVAVRRCSGHWSMNFFFAGCRALNFFFFPFLFPLFAETMMRVDET